MEENKKNSYSWIWEFILIPAILLAAGIYIIYPFFRGIYTQYMGSIEVAFFTDAKYIYENFPNLSWNPLWYLGFPYHLVYNPFLPYLIAFIKLINSALEFSHIYRIVVASFYIFGGVTFYFFCRYIFRNAWPAAIVGLAYTLLPSFGHFITGGPTDGFLGQPPERLKIIALYGEGPHSIALVLIPLAALALLHALKKPSFLNKILAALLISWVALTNWIGLLTLVIISFVILFSEIMVDLKVGKKIKDVFFVFVLSFGLSSFWFNWSFIKAGLGFGKSGQGEIFSNYTSIFPILIIILPLFIGVLVAMLGRRSKIQPFVIGGLWFLFFFSVVVLWNFAKQNYLPQSGRFVPEVEMGAYVLIGAFLNYIYKKISFSKIVNLFLKTSFVIVFFAVVILLSLSSFDGNHKLLKPRSTDIEKSYEYNTAQWFEENTQGERIYVTGNNSFWFNYFTDVPQLRGPADPAVTHPWVLHAFYQINTSENAPRGQEGKLALQLMRALNVSYFLVNGSGSPEIYQDWEKPSKFEGLAEVVYDYNGDKIYKVPLKNPSLAQLVDASEMENLKTPYNAVDVDPIEDYVEWVEDENKPEVDFRWLSNQKAEIEADISEGEAISVQITYDKGWKAYLDGKKIETKKDAIGNLVVIPNDSGRRKILLVHKRTLNIWLGYLIFLITLFIIVFRIFELRRIKKVQKNEN